MNPDAPKDLLITDVSADQNSATAPDGTRLAFAPHPEDGSILSDPCVGCYLARYPHSTEEFPRCFVRYGDPGDAIAANLCLVRKDGLDGRWLPAKEGNA